MGLHVVQSGPPDGLPVVFLHGAAAKGARMWRPQLSELSSDLRCLAVDLPGHGGSSTESWESLDGAAEQVAEVIRGLAGGRAAVVGLSLGGYVAVRLAMLEPELVSCAIISGVSVLPATFGTRVWQRGQLIARYSTFGTLMAGNGRSAGNPDEAGGGAVVAARPVPRQTLMKIADEMVNFHLPDRPRRFEGALLAVAGEHEHHLVLKSLRPLAERFTDGRAKYAPEAGHSWHLERPELFNATVRSWVTDLRLPPRLRDPEQWSE